MPRGKKIVISTASILEPGWEFQDAGKLLDRLDKKIFPYDEVYPKAKPDHYWWGSYVNDRLVGFSGLKVFPEDNFAFFCRAGVLEKYRGIGLHRRMVTQRLRKAKALGLESVVSYTSMDNSPSSNNLIRAGFTLYEPDWKWVGGGFLYWKKFIGED